MGERTRKKRGLHRARTVGALLVTLAVVAANAVPVGVPSTVRAAVVAHELTVAAADTPLFTDIVGHPDEASILELVELGVVSGYGSGLFGPDDPVTREQFAKMLVLASGMQVYTAPDQTVELGFTDASAVSDWARVYVQAAVNRGLIKGLPDGRFAPKLYVTRAQALTMIARALVGEAALQSMAGGDAATGFADDAAIESWARPAVNCCLNEGIVLLSDYASLEPGKDCTRAMNCRYLARFADELAGTFAVTLFKAGDDRVDCVEPTSDGGYILVGTAGPYNRRKGWVQKVDAKGEKEWSKTLDDDGWLQSVQPTSDGGYILAGVLDDDAWIVKVDTEGEEEWSKTFDGGTDGRDGAGSVIQTSDGGFAFAGYAEVADDRTDGWLVKLDASGRKEWAQTYQDSDEEWDGDVEVNSVRQTKDNGYILALTTTVVFWGGGGGYPSSTGWALKTDSRGVAQWAWPSDLELYSGDQIDEVYLAEQTDDGSYVLAGHFYYNAWAYSFDVPAFEDFQTRLTLTTLDAQGHETWSATTDMGAFVSAISRTSDGGYILAGREPSVIGEYCGTLIKTDALGNVEWSRAFGLGMRDEPQWVAETPDGGYIVGGSSISREYKPSHIYAWLVKTDAQGNVAPRPFPKSLSPDPEDWTDEWTWTYSPGQRYLYEVKYYEPGEGTETGTFELQVVESWPGVAVGWTIDLGGEELKNSCDLEPDDRLGWWPLAMHDSVLIYTLDPLPRLKSPDAWEDGSYWGGTVKVSGRSTYAGITGANVTASGWQGCINPNVPLALHSKSTLPGGAWVELTLTEIEGF